MTTKLCFSLFFIFLLTGFTGCEKPTEPKADPPKADTTSHNFVWDVDTIGYRNTTLSDGVIINETDMWVAGEIYPDSASYWNGPRHGLAHWDGKKWTTEVVMARTDVENPEIKEASIIRGMAVVDKNEIFISTGFLLMKRENIKWVEKAQDIIDKKAFSKIWGSNSNNLYIYGSNGGLYHYNGTTLTSIPTNTSLDIMDIHGDWNPKTGEYELLALASTDKSHLNGSILLKVGNNSVSELSIKGIDAYQKGDLWFFQGSNYWITGDGVFFKKNLSDSAWTPIENFPSSNWVTADIGGWSPNDLFLIQGDGHILHFNGSTWKDFKTDLHLREITIRKIIVKHDLVMLLGGENNSNPKGIIIRGKKLN
ncbi:MAG: hypothetical protein L6Q77_07430 [Bacteroidetes bacterium]|nr:hypothetical protein [Bacteroidota bacterium]